MRTQKLSLLVIFAVLLLAAVMVVGCSDADVASSNLSKAADQFEIDRRIVFYNGITGEYILVIEGKCSLGNNDSARKLTVTCKTGDNEYKKHFLGLSDNVTFFAEQVKSESADRFRYRVIFKPDAVLPDVDLVTGVGQ